jgi:hypothetical protein
MTSAARQPESSSSIIRRRARCRSSTQAFSRTTIHH